MALSTEYLTGFEYGLLSTSGTGIADTLLGASLQTSGSRNGSYHCRMTANAGGSRFLRLLGSDATRTKVVFRLGFKVISIGASGTVGYIISFGGSVNVFAVRVNATTGNIEANVPGGTFEVGPNVDDGAWHLLEGQADWSTGSPTLDWKVDGVAQTQATGSIASAQIDRFSLGTVSLTHTITCDYDDVIFGRWTNAATDWYGDGKVLSLLPGADGTHNTAGAEFIGGDTATTPNFTNATTTAYQLVDDAPPWTTTRSTTDNISAETHSAGRYMEVKPAASSSPDSATANAVRAWLAYSSAGTQANLAAAQVVSSAGGGGGGTVDIFGTINGTGADYSEGSNFFKGAVATDPTAGWTNSEVEEIRLRVGLPSGAGDVAPRPTWQMLLLEVDYPIAPAVTYTPNRRFKAYNESVQRASAW